MNAKKTQLITLAIAAGMVSMAQAAITDELPGNLFHQTGSPYLVAGTLVNNPQNMGGGTNIGGGNYPYNNDSPVLDGNVTTAWSGGETQTHDVTFPPPTKTYFGMMNIGFSAGYWNTDASDFVNTTYNQIGQIRIWATNYDNGDGTFWIKFPSQVQVAYTNNVLTMNTITNGYSYNSDNLVGTPGTTPTLWDQIATISSVNGVAPISAGAGYDTGFVGLDGQWNVVQTNGHASLAYVDLALDIPAGARDVLLSFGQQSRATGSQGGISIADVQAVSVPEPVSMGLLSLATMGLLARRRHA